MSLFLSLSLILFLRKFNIYISFSDSVITRVYYTFGGWFVIHVFLLSYYNIASVSLAMSLSLALSLSLSNSVITLSFILILILPRYVTLHLRIANHMVMDSCCRGGIVHIRCGYSRALFARPESSKALWRFRASTSNILSDRI